MSSRSSGRFEVIIINNVSIPTFSRHKNSLSPEGKHEFNPFNCVFLTVTSSITLIDMEIVQPTTKQLSFYVPQLLRSYSQPFTAPVCFRVNSEGRVDVFRFTSGRYISRPPQFDPILCEVNYCTKAMAIGFSLLHQMAGIKTKQMTVLSIFGKEDASRT